MYELTIPAMTCGHCQGVITRTVLALDPAATLHFDLTGHKVKVATMLQAAALGDALGQAGYPVSDVQEARTAVECCGQCGT